MKKKQNVKGTLIALSVAGMFACGQSTEEKKPEAPAVDAKVQCAGINECKGKSDCHAVDGSHSCGTLNACKGKGWLSVASKECEEKKGTIVVKK